MGDGMTISNERIFELAAQLLDMAGEKFGNHGCNDFKLPDWSPAERRQLAIDYEEYNGDAGEVARLDALPVGHSEFEWFSDFCLMYYAAHRLRGLEKWVELGPDNEIIRTSDEPISRTSLANRVTKEIDVYKWEPTGLHKINGDKFGTATGSTMVQETEYRDLLAERDLLLACYDSYDDSGECPHHCTCMDSGCDACKAAHAYKEWKNTQHERECTR